MNSVESIYLAKLNKFQSVLDAKAAKIGGASGAFEDILNGVTQRLERSEAPTQAASDVYGAWVSPADAGQTLKVSAATAEIEAAVSRAAGATGLDPALIKAVIQVESSFRPGAVSHCGAQGLMQLMPGTAKSLGVTDSFDVDQNVMGGATYIRQQLARFGDLRLALAAYNTGPGRIGKLNITDANDSEQYARISSGVRGYVDKVLAYYKQFSAM